MVRLHRRNILIGLAGLPLAIPALGQAGAPPSDRYAAALAAIRAYADAHRRKFHLPALTLALVAPDAPAMTLNLGEADPAVHAPLTGDTLFEIGSISKSMTAIVIHQMVAEGKLALSDDARTLLPGAPWPDTPITVQQLLDHTTGLPDDAPHFLPDGRKLWLGFAPGSHWSYSNTGYGFLGLIAERIDKRPLNAIFATRLFRPIGMTSSRGNLVSSDRQRFAVGYNYSDNDRPTLDADLMAPVPFIDFNAGSGSVGSNAADMARYLAAIVAVGRGKGGLGLSPADATRWFSHAVAAEESMRYGNGLMHVTDKAGVAYVHHTGGMLAFSSAFHVDAAAGTGAFASSSLSGFLGYRPRALTLYATQALTAAAAGKPIPAPPALGDAKTPADLAGRFVGPSGTVDIATAGGLTVRADGETAPAEAVGRDAVITHHPRFAALPLIAIREKDKLVALSYGSDVYVRDGSSYRPAPSDPKLSLLAGRYVSDSPWNGTTFIIERGGKLFLAGNELVATKHGDYRPAEPSWSPERVRFDAFVDGRPQILFLSETPFERRDI